MSELRYYVRVGDADDYRAFTSIDGVKRHLAKKGAHPPFLSFRPSQAPPIGRSPPSAVAFGGLAAEGFTGQNYISLYLGPNAETPERDISENDLDVLNARVSTRPIRGGPLPDGPIGGPAMVRRVADSELRDELTRAKADGKLLPMKATKPVPPARPPHCWVYNENRRKYREVNGKRVGDLIDIESWEKVEIVGETRDYWTLAHWCYPLAKPRVPKAGHPCVVFTWEEAVRRSYVRENANEISRIVRDLPYETLKVVADLVGYVAEPPKPEPT